MQLLPKAFYRVYFSILYGIIVHTNGQHADLISGNDYSFCQSRDCIRHANMILKNINPEVDPCQDFYSFACGGYKGKFGVNETRSVYDDTWHLLQTQIKELVEDMRPEDESSSQKLKFVFENCMNIKSSQMKAVQDSVDFLSAVGIPNWPKLNEDFIFPDLSKTLGKLAAFGEFAFASFKHSPYNSQPTNIKPPPALLLQGNFLLNSKMKSKDVHSSVARVLNYFNIPKNETENIWNEFVEIENAGIRLQNEESTDPLNCKSTARDAFKEVNCSENTVGNMKLLCNFWRFAVEEGDLDAYYTTDTIHISCSWTHSHYLYNIFPLLDKLSDRSLANYLSLRFFISHLDDLNLYFHLTKRTYPGDKHSKTSEPITRWEYCVGWITKSMSLALGYEYTQKILTKNIENSVLEIIKDYIEELSSSIRTLSWLSERIKLYLQRQILNLDIGFRKTVENYRNKTLVETSYKMFKPTKGSFLKNILEYQKMSLTTKEQNMFNSFYSSSDPYTIDFGMTLLQPPTFSHGLPKMWNYAALGFVIGHELSHNLKSFFDFVYLDEPTENYLNNKIQCFIDQYSQFVIKKTHKTINSSETKEEIVADNLGWRLSEKIIMKVINEKSNEIFKLPGLSYTPLQLMFIVLAQDSCAVLSKDVEAEFYASKPHNLANLRVNGVLQNSKIFSDVFSCAVGSTMNPENKCTFF